MSFPRYPEYKDSGVEWLGEIPGHWQLLPLKRDIAFLTSGARGWAEHYSEEGALFLRIGNLTRDGIGLDLSEIQRVEVPEGVEGARTKVQEGDVLFSITAYLGSVAVVPNGLDTAYVSQHVALARLRKALFLPEWVAYVVSSWIGKTYLETQGYGGTKVQLSLEDVANTLITVPPLSEQLLIATFVRHEVAKIDSLMGEQEKLIVLLKEKRQAVISQAVTKGLDLAVPMKDSEIEWLGEVPNNWAVNRLKHLTPQITVGVVVEPSKHYVDDGVPALRSLNVQPGKIKKENLVYISEESNELLIKSRLSAGDIVAVRSGQTGTAAVVPAELDGCNCIDLIIIRKPTEGCERFLCWFFASSAARYQFEGGSDGAIQQHFNIGTAMNLIVTCPPIDAQIEIANYLDQATANIDRLTEAALDVIELLKERRIALISAAVTGKIDVRALVKDEQEDAA